MLDHEKKQYKKKQSKYSLRDIKILQIEIKKNYNL